MKQRRMSELLCAEEEAKPLIALHVCHRAPLMLVPPPLFTTDTRLRTADTPLLLPLTTTVLLLPGRGVVGGGCVQGDEAEQRRHLRHAPGGLRCCRGGRRPAGGCVMMGDDDWVMITD